MRNVLGRSAAMLVVLGGIAGTGTAGMPEGAVWSQPETVPTAEELFARHVREIGGAEALARLKNKVIVGTMQIPSLKVEGILNIWAVAPDALRMRMEIPGRGTFEFGFDGQNGWQTSLEGKSFALTGPALDAMIEDADFLGEANYTKRYTTLGIPEATTFNERLAYRVPAVTTRGREIQVYFDAQTGLNLGVMLNRRNDEGKEVGVIVRLADYKEFNGVRHPTKVTIKEGEDYEEIRTYTRVRFDVEPAPTIKAPATLLPPPSVGGG